MRVCIDVKKIGSRKAALRGPHMIREQAEVKKREPNFARHMGEFALEFDVPGDWLGCLPWLCPSQLHLFYHPSSASFATPSTIASS